MSDFSASTLIGDLVIGFLIAFAVVWATIKVFEVLYYLWKWLKKADDRIISNMASERARRQLSMMTDAEKEKLYEELLDK